MAGLDRVIKGMTGDIERIMIPVKGGLEEMVVKTS